MKRFLQRVVAPLAMIAALAGGIAYIASGSEDAIRGTEPAVERPRGDAPAKPENERPVEKKKKRIFKVFA